MEQVAWAAIGLLAVALFGVLGMMWSMNQSLSARIDALGESLGARIDALGARLDARIDALSGPTSRSDRRAR